MTGLFDYHTHTARCKHAQGTMEEYVQAGIRAGLSEMGFSDHLPLPVDGPSPSNMEPGEFPGYVEEVLSLKAAHSGFPLRLGVEADYVEGAESRLAELLRLAPLDYVIGSVHLLRQGPGRPLAARGEGLWEFDNPDRISEWSGRDVDAVWSHYFGLLRRAAASGLFHVIGHADLPKKFGHRPSADFKGVYLQTAGAFKAAGVVVELNTAGLRKPVGEIYPGQEFLRVLREAGVGVTLGSDAHSPGEVAFEFGQALQWARRAGYESLHRWAAPGRFEPVKMP